MSQITSDTTSMNNNQYYIDIINGQLNNTTYPTLANTLFSPIKYTLQMGGKRIRPLLTLLACEAFGKPAQEALNAALGLEIFHNYTLLHDDIMDKAEVRRGKPVAHKIFGENSAILSGDAMHILSYQYVANATAHTQPDVLRHFLNTAMLIHQGQQLDMEFEQRENVIISEYIEMIRLKTAVLVGEALRMGALIGGASTDDAQAFYAFGEAVGLSFQLRDDYLDSFGNPAVFGKNLGGDILCNKKTFLMIEALNSPMTDEASLLHQWIEKKTFDPQQKINEVSRIFQTTGAAQKSMATAQTIYNEGLSIISNIQCQNPIALQRIIDTCEQLLSREI